MTERERPSTVPQTARWPPWQLAPLVRSRTSNCPASDMLERTTAGGAKSAENQVAVMAMTMTMVKLSLSPVRFLHLHGFVPPKPPVLQSPVLGPRLAPPPPPPRPFWHPRSQTPGWPRLLLRPHTPSVQLQHHHYCHYQHHHHHHRCRHHNNLQRQRQCTSSPRPRQA